LQSIEVAELQEQCCVLLGVILDKLGSIPPSESANILGDQLQAIVSRLVACITAANQQSGLEGSDIGGDPFGQHSDGSTEEDHKLANCTSLVVLLRRLTVEATDLLSPYIKELDPFPNLPYFEPMQALHTELCAGRSLADDFVQFVQRAPSLPPQLRLSSLRSLVNQLSARKGELYTKAKGDEYHGGSWRCSPEVVEAVWKLVQLCNDRDNLDMRDLAGTFLSAVGIGDPHAVVFHLPKKPEEKSNRLAAGVDIANATVTIDAQLGVSDNLVRQILQQIRGYLIDNNVHIIDLAAKTLKGLLSTEKGHRVLKSMSLQESAYLEVHSKGINLNLVEEILRSSKLESSRVAIAIDNPLLWQTTGESYDIWLCPLAYSLIEYSDDCILRLCQELVLQKAPLAELVFPHVLGNLAAWFESSSEFCRKFSEQVEEHVFGERNNSTRSIQLFLGAMNCLRCCYITANMNHSSTAPSRGRDSKGEKSLGNGGETGTGSARKRQSDHGDAEKGGSEPGNQHHWIRSSWQKVYWLQIDYLSTARAAQRCGAYFTTVLYMENWCEETFGRLTLGEPDFSINDALPAHLELLLNVYTKINEPDGVYGVVRSHKVSSLLPWLHIFELMIKNKK
jgi:ataxia telangiectasia mutated family protein